MLITKVFYNSYLFYDYSLRHINKKKTWSRRSESDVQKHSIVSKMKLEENARHYQTTGPVFIRQNSRLRHAKDVKTNTGQ